MYDFMKCANSTSRAGLWDLGDRWDTVSLVHT
jgi:hypothetical protein